MDPRHLPDEGWCQVDPIVVQAGRHSGQPEVLDGGSPVAGAEDAKVNRVVEAVDPGLEDHGVAFHRDGTERVLAPQRRGDQRQADDQESDGIVLFPQPDRSCRHEQGNRDCQQDAEIGDNAQRGNPGEHEQRCVDGDVSHEQAQRKIEEDARGQPLPAREERAHQIERKEDRLAREKCQRRK